VAFVPYAAHLPFETWILPRDGHVIPFGRLEGRQTHALAEILKVMLLKLFVALENPAFNLMMTCPGSEEQALPMAHPHLAAVGDSRGLKWERHVDHHDAGDAAAFLRDGVVWSLACWGSGPITSSAVTIISATRTIFMFLSLAVLQPAKASFVEPGPLHQSALALDNLAVFGPDADPRPAGAGPGTRNRRMASAMAVSRSLAIGPRDTPERSASTRSISDASVGRNENHRHRPDSDGRGGLVPSISGV
jgi:hypothetical protein